MKSTLETKGLDALVKRMRRLANISVKVGFFENDKYEDGMQVAQVAAYNHYGTKFHPERPFMDDAMQDKSNLSIMRRHIKLAAKSSVYGTGNAHRIMSKLGYVLVGMIKITIANYPGNNSPATVSRKGFDRPLYDMGKMLDSVRFRFT